MSWLDGARERLRFAFRRGHAEWELAEELAFHYEQDVAAGLARGLSRAEAVRQARLRFGGRDRWVEEVRDSWSGVFRGVGQDVRVGVRRLRSEPWLTAAALATLALGIGANTAMFSVVRSVLLEPLPYPAADRLVMVWQADRGVETWVSQREIVEYGRAVRGFEAVGGYTDFHANLSDGEPERVLAAAATFPLLDVLGVRVMHGRTFTAAEDEPGSDAVVLLSHALWQRRFGGTPDAVGRTLRVNGTARTVIGVLHPEFRMPLDFRDDARTDLLVPMAIDPTAALGWGDRGSYIVARLAAGVTAEQATAEMHAAFGRWVAAGEFADEDGQDTRRAYPLNDLLLGSVRPALLVLLGAVGFILLIACANVANLLLARADARRTEVAVQAALGASRLRVVRALLIEAGVLASAGALLGVALAYVIVTSAGSVIPVNVIRVKGVQLDLAVLGFTALLVLITTVLAGLAPALQISRTGMAGVTRGVRGEGAPLRGGTRRLLIALETALSLVLVVGAALLARSFIELRRIDPGFDASNILTAQLALSAADYPEAARVNAFYDELIERLRALPGVESAAAVRVLPFAAPIGNWSITLEGRVLQDGSYPQGDWQIVTPGYFETMGMQRVEGRTLTPADREGAPLVVLVSEAMARAYWPDGNALGSRFHLGTSDQPWLTVVGIVRSVRHHGLLEAPRTEMYVPHAQWPSARGDGRPQRSMAVVVRTADDPLALAAPLREQVRALDATVPVADVRTMEQIAGGVLAEPRFTALLLGSFALLALLLAAVGVGGVIAFGAARRTHELGIRRALGASRGTLVRTVMAEGMIAAALGVAAGILAALGLTRLLAAQLYGVSALDPAIFTAAAIILLGVAALAALLPALRAARVSPGVALRAE